MFFKERVESDELKSLRALNFRSELDPNDRYRYWGLEKGFEGEVTFDKLLAGNLQEERYVLSDMLFEVKNSYFQIDTLMISQGLIHLLDVKNYEGDFYLDGEKFCAVKNTQEYSNPLTQLTRSTSLFRQLLQNLKLNHLVDATVIFVHPEFYLYNALVEQPIIFPTQLNRFFSQLKTTPSKLNDGHKKLAQTLLSLHKTKYPYAPIPKYTYDHLQKGIYCREPHCGSFLLAKARYELVCTKCGAREKNDAAILRSVAELVLLFPEIQLTTDVVYEWCGRVFSRKTIYRVLSQRFSALGNNKSKYYI